MANANELTICLECGRAMGEGDPGESECLEHGARVQRVARPRADPPVLTIAAGDVWSCTCGNIAENDGFYPSDATGAELSPDEGGPWDARTYTCGRCSAVFTLPAAFLEHYYAGAHTTVVGACGTFRPLGDDAPTKEDTALDADDGTIADA